MRKKLTATDRVGKPEVVTRLLIEDIPVEIRPNRRRKSRIGLVLDPAGFVVLDAPANVSEGEVRAVIIEHQRWLRYRLHALQAEQTSAGNPSSRLNYQDGELIYLFGKPLALKVEPALLDSLTLHDDVLHVFATDIAAPNIGAQVKDWYRQRAAAAFAEVLEAYRRLPWMNDRTPPWSQRFMRSQWGSCSASGKLSLNTHLVKTPRELIEYVVLHELCHLQHHHHGQAFHRLVETHMPDWRRRSTALNKYLPVLMQE